MPPLYKDTYRSQEAFYWKVGVKFEWSGRQMMVSSKSETK